VRELSGDLGGALDALVLVWDLHAAIGANSAQQEVGPRLVRLAVLSGRSDRVDDVVAHVARLRDVVGTETAAADDEWVRAWRDDDPDALRRAIAHQERTPRRLAVAQQRAQLAQMLADGGATAEAAEVASQARRDLEGCGAAGDAAAVAVLEGSGRRADPATTGPQALSRSERRVVVMIGAGMTNAEIAEALFVSRRTVESHVSASYRKLRVGNRVELARIGMDLVDA
jgi:DNA-binding CsgD family transcriptional regulator